jgi:hypothetical protein
MLRPYSVRFIAWLRGLRSLTTHNVCHGMTSLDEQSYFRRYAARNYSGLGEIVDLGCWLGSTTIPLAQGLRNNLNVSMKQKRIHAYDLFIWEDWMNPYKDGCRRQYSRGESFLEEYKARTDNFSDLIQIYAGDLQQIGWLGKPIEFLLVDAMKSWELAESVVKQFYPHLVPEQSLLLHQDFKHYYTSWIHLIQYRLREYFTFELDVLNSSSVVFRLQKPVDCDLTWLADLKSCSNNDIEEAFDYSLSLTRGKSASIAAAKVMCFVHLNRLGEARRALGDSIRHGFSQESELAVCKKILADREAQI